MTNRPTTEMRAAAIENELVHYKHVVDEMRANGLDDVEDFDFINIVLHDQIEATLNEEPALAPVLRPLDTRMVEHFGSPSGPEDLVCATIESLNDYKRRCN